MAGNKMFAHDILTLVGKKKNESEKKEQDLSTVKTNHLFSG